MFSSNVRFHVSQTNEFTSCSDCGAPISEPSNTLLDSRVPCPACGSTKRAFYVEVTEKITVRQKTGLKHLRPGSKKPIYESIQGDDLHRISGQWNHLSREIDRENNRYREHIANPVTGDVIRSVDEPLSQHIGHGSAKHKGNGGGNEA